MGGGITLMFFRMVFANSKRYLKDYKNIAIMFLLPIICVALTNFLVNNSEKGLNIEIAIINMDGGNYGKQLASDLGVNNVFYSKETAVEGLKNYNYSVVYEIPENFSESIDNNIKPTINAYKIEKGNSTQIFEANLQAKLNNLLKVKLLEKNRIIENQKELDKNIIYVDYNMKKGLLSADSFVPILMILFFIMNYSINISVDLLKLKKDKILERFLSTGNKGYAIMGSIYLSMVAVQVSMYTLSFIIMNFVFKYNFQNFWMLIMNIALMSMVSISLSLMVIRIFKDNQASSLISILLSMTMFFLYIYSISNHSDLSTALGKFTPFYWAMDSIEKSVVFPNIFIIILMILVLFTAGSIRYSSFAKES